MRIPALTLCAAVAAGSFLSLGAAASRADTPSGPSVAAPTQIVPRADRAQGPQRATRAEERDYARREAAAPADVKKYRGGFIVAVLVVVALVLLIIYLARRT
jgi:hypothetical protein